MLETLRNSTAVSLADLNSDISDWQLNSLLKLADVDITLAKSTTVNISSLKSGWNFTAYGSSHVCHNIAPTEDAFILDCETFVKAGNYPIIGTAADTTGLYVWIHPAYFNGGDYFHLRIPLYRDKPQIMISHNISFDFTKIENRYGLDNNIQGLCTMGLGKILYSVDRFNRYLLKVEPSYGGVGRLAHRLQKLACEMSLISLYNHVIRPEEKLTKEDKKEREIFIVAEDFFEFIDNYETSVKYAIKDTVLTLELYAAMFPLVLRKLTDDNSKLILNGLIQTSDSLAPIRLDYSDWLNDAIVASNNIMFKVWSLLLPYVSEFHTECINGYHDMQAYKLDWRFAKPLGYRKRKDPPNYPIAHRWYVEFLKGNMSYFGHDLAYILQLRWHGHLCERSQKTGWTSQGKAIPSPDGKSEKIGYILVGNILPYIEEDELTSDLLSKEDFKKLIELLASYTTFKGYQERFKTLEIGGYSTIDSIRQVKNV